MGVWGAKLYQDDVAKDVRDQFKDLLHSGKATEEITKQLIDEYACIMDDPDDGPVFWFALADTQWNLGRLLPEVKEQALVWLDKGINLARWQEENPKMAVDRKNVLEELRQKLNSPQPPEKKVSQYRLYKCEWKTGDVFAYQLESDLAKEKCLFGRYFLIQKVDEGIWHPGHIIPIVHIKITKDSQLPASSEEFDQLEYVQTSSRQFDLLAEEFRPDSKNLTEEEFWRKVEERRSQLEFDDFNLLPVFRVKLLNTSNKIIPTKLVFIGNFPKTKSPYKEFIPRNKIELPTLHWKKFNETLETQLIRDYCGHNLRQLPIYQSK